MRNAHKMLIGKPAGKRLLGRTRRSWEYILQKLNLRMCSNMGSACAHDLGGIRKRTFLLILLTRHIFVFRRGI